jgi:hypothetical protein
MGASAHEQDLQQSDPQADPAACVTNRIQEHRLDLIIGNWRRFSS